MWLKYEKALIDGMVEGEILTRIGIRIEFLLFYQEMFRPELRIWYCGQMMIRRERPLGFCGEWYSAFFHAKKISD